VALPSPPGCLTIVDWVVGLSADFCGSDYLSGGEAV